DGEEAVLFNVFDAPTPVDACLVEQYALYIEPAWTPAKSDAWYACAAKNAGTLGTWGMQARRRSDGASITGSLQTYVWGWSDQLLPSGEVAYLVETLPTLVRFDRADVPDTALTVMTLVNGLWQSIGVLPVAGPPKIVLEAARGANGVGSSTGLAELSLRDADDDGIAELELTGGQWIEYDGSAFAVQP
ncbi:MAG TPA: hypothetical protein VFB62_27400, partial [Polyangiaceae bacterium]|nr:hypothetical protein [Polyangiaceae bacterium]